MKYFALTIGDPCGIGPGITAKIVRSLSAEILNHILIIGNRKNFEKTFERIHGFACKIRTVQYVPGKTLPGELFNDSSESCNLNFLDTAEDFDFLPGKICAEAGAVAVKSIEIAHQLCKDGICSGMINGPIGKEAIRISGSTFSGHTDMLCALTGARLTRMAMIYRDFRVVMTTLHVSWRKVPELITIDSVYDTILLAYENFRAVAKPFPKIAVAGLNPHAGENGLFGNEERDHIIPAIERFRGNYSHIAGPFPADSMFTEKMRSEYNIFVTHSHDQGLIAIKTLGGLECVNVTLGLPYIRTAVGHGTAYEMASGNSFDERGLAAAIKCAFSM
ncbi:MAG: 4-hydroxythreonine-4-phosphate dehydrogenase PdxA [Candidatus Riflebacteria bacterium]|nr:4-hydroxythreonine-4-phosphate dehydrogenase PdxA [Candidatus Riflebacteria bacterium]